MIRFDLLTNSFFYFIKSFYLSCISSCILLNIISLFPISSTNCTSCDPLANRILIVNACLPISHYYDAGVAVAVVCDPSCLNCVTTATNCIPCESYSYNNGSACVNCTTYDVNCLTCAVTGCSACASDYIPSGTACVTCQFLFGSSCMSCTSSTCTACTTDSFIPISGTNCSLCSSVYSPQCLICASIGCT
jgi:hypothetical protein